MARCVSRHAARRARRRVRGVARAQRHDRHALQQHVHSADCALAKRRIRQRTSAFFFFQSYVAPIALSQNLNLTPTVLARRWPMWPQLFDQRAFAPCNNVQYLAVRGGGGASVVRTRARAAKFALSGSNATLILVSGVGRKSRCSLLMLGMEMDTVMTERSAVCAV